MLGLGLGLNPILGGGGARLSAWPATFAAGHPAGTVVATLSRPFGADTVYAPVGSVPAQLALSGGAIVAGAGAAVAGASYAIKVRATSGDARREVAETLAFTALAGTAAPLASYALTAATLPAGVSYARAGNATRRGSDGGWQSVGANVPRDTYRYTGGGWAAAGVYLTGAFTNVVPYAFDPNLNWVAASGATKTAAATLGVLNRGIVIASAGSGSARFILASANPAMLTAGQKYLYEFWFAWGTSAKARLYFTGASYMPVNAAGIDGSKVQGDGAVGALVSLVDTGGGLMRAVAEFTPTGSGNTQPGIGPNSAVAGETVAAYGVQAVAAPAYPGTAVNPQAIFPGAPILTAGGTTATKSADAFTLAPAAIANGTPYTLRLGFANGATQDRNVVASGGVLAVPSDNAAGHIVAQIDVLPLQPVITEAIVGTTKEVLDPVTGASWRTQSPGKPWSLRRATNRERLYVEFEVRPGDIWPGDTDTRERCEMVPSAGDPMAVLPFDADVWFSGWFAIAVDGTIPSDGGASHIAIMQYHDVPDAGDAQPNPPFELQLYADGLLHVKTVGQPLGTPTSAQAIYASDRGTIPVIVTGMAAEPAWQRLVVRARFSRTGNGSLSIWKDGVLAFENLAFPFGTNDAVGPYVKFGCYSVPKLPDAVTRRVRWAAVEHSLASLADRVANPVPIL